MHQVQLTDQLYKQAQQRAMEAGFPTVEEYVAEVLSNDLHADAENLDHLFTPERLAHIDGVIAEVNAGGKTYSIEEVGVELAARRADWIQKNDK